MLNSICKYFILILIPLLSIETISTAEMSSDSFFLSSSVMDSTGKSKSSDTFTLRDSVGQPTPIGVSTSFGFKLEAGFLYTTQFTNSIKVTLPNVIEGLNDILLKTSLNKKEDKSIHLAIKFLEEALIAYTLFENGDFGALANALNKTKSAIKKMISVKKVDTTTYQKMLSQTAKLAVTTEINIISTVAGNNNPNVIQAGIFLNEGSTELLNGFYFEAVQSFVKAYKEALLAIN